MITLDPTLATRMDSRDREPIIEIISDQFVDSVPFDGNLLNNNTTSEQKPKVIVLESGQVFGTYIHSSSYLYFAFTDESGTSWVQQSSGLSGFYSASSAELPNGNIMVIGLQDLGTHRDIIQLEVSPLGAIIGDPVTVLAEPEATSALEGITVCVLPNGNYIAAYTSVAAGIYKIHSIETSDLTTWSSPVEITLGSLLPERAKRNPFLLSTSVDGLLLFFDYVSDLKDDGSELTNIYYTKGDPNGGSWGTPVKLTNFTVFGVSAEYPTAGERANGDIVMAYTEKSVVLQMDGSTEGWCWSSYSVYCGEGSSDPFYTFYDRSTHLLYVITGYAYVGGQHYCAVQVVDVITWTVVRCYTTTSIPGLHEAVLPGGSSNFIHQEAPYVIVGNSGSVALIDDNAQTVTHLIFSDNATQLLTKNVQWDSEIEGGICYLYMDADAQRIYIQFLDGWIWSAGRSLVYLDLTQEPDDGMWTCTTLVANDPRGGLQHNGPEEIVIAQDINSVFLCNADPARGNGILVQYSLEDGAEIRRWTQLTDSSFPYLGMYHVMYDNGVLWGSFSYTTAYDEQNKRGLVKLDLSTESCTYYRPTWATIDSYSLKKKLPMDDGRIIMGSAYGPTIFDPSDWSWKLFNNEAIPGLTPWAQNNCIDAIYIEDTDSIVAGILSHLYWSGLVMFNEEGNYYQGKYMDATFGTDWDFEEAEDLTISMYAKDNAIAIAPDNVMWGLWADVNGSELSLAWDSEAAWRDLTDLLKTSVGVELSWKVGTPATLGFTCSHGHLFDESNTLSLLSQFLRKGRLVVVRMGEVIEGVKYWVKQGTWVVTDTRLSYERGKYPDIAVTCQDRSALYEHSLVIASKYFDNTYPEDVITEMMETYGNLTIADLADFDTRHLLNCQYIDEELNSVLSELLAHLEYFSFWNVDGDYEPRRVNLTKSPDHIYTESNLQRYTPDTSFSTFTNIVTVTGESKDLLEVIHPEEVVAQVSGTMGYWGGTKVETAYYSDDHEKICRDPRMDVIIDVGSFDLFGYSGGGSQSITYEDPEGTYVEITIEGPNLTQAIITNVIALGAAGASAVGCDGFGSGYCGPMILLVTTLMSTLTYFLSCIASYQYEIYAKPVGEERQTIQCKAEDYGMIHYLDGTEIVEKLDDPYCDTVAECCRVANYEIDIVKAQRRRVTATKLTHLQDELGDMIKFKHPFTNLDMEVLIVELKRKFTKPEQNGTGGVIDELTLWRKE